MSGVKISFLMIAYNTEKYIEKAINSILNQSMKNINLFVRNNGSTDSTGEIIQRIGASDPRVHVIHNKKNWYNDDGTGLFKNGVFTIWDIEDRDSLGEYISIVDSDDWLTSNFAETMYRAAKEADADFTVCGCRFMTDEKQNTGIRVPPQISTNDFTEVSEIIRDNFIDLYNTLRTWWGKLFRTDFFYEHYNFAWEIKLGVMLDTVHMLRYFMKAKSFVAIKRALYYFRMHGGSTYQGKPRRYGVVKQAEELYYTGLKFLDTFNARTDINETFLFQLHWTYLLEAFGSLNNTQSITSPKKELSWLASMLNNSALSNFFDSEMDGIWKTAGDYIKIILKSDNIDLSMYTSYLTRLAYAELLIASENYLAFPILIGCLYDTENKNLLGKQFLHRAVIAKEFETLAFGSRINISGGTIEYLIFYKSLLSKFPYLLAPTEHEYKGVEKVNELEKQLLSAMESEDYELVCDLLEKLLTLNPLSRDAMYCRIKISMMIEEYELAAVLAGTAISLWPSDTEIQILCWDVIGKVSKN